MRRAEDAAAFVDEPQGEQVEPEPWLEYGRSAQQQFCASIFDELMDVSCEGCPASVYETSRVGKLRDG